MPVKKTNHCYDLDKCLVEWELIQLRLGDKLYEPKYGHGRQTCLQRKNKNVVNPYTDGVGEKRQNKNRIIKDVHLEYTVLNEVYEGTIYADIIDDVDGVRSRIMFMDAYTNYSVHKDQTPRYHLALITNPNAYFIFPTLNEIIHIPPDGFLYEVDTTLPHSFVNCGPDRTHLLISKRSSS